MSRWNKKPFSIYESQERSMLGLMKELGDQTNFNTEENERLQKEKLDLDGNFVGSWFGIEKPEFADPGIANIVNEHGLSINDLNVIVDEVIKKLSTKAEITQIWGMGNMGQDVKEAMTSGSVAVVGKNSIGSEQYKFNSMTSNKTTFIEQGNNLLDAKSMVHGYLNSNGSIVPSANHKTTDFILIKGSKLTLGRMSNVTERLSQPRDIRFVCFYDSNYESITDIFYNNNNSMPEVVTIPQQAVYMRVTLQIGYTQDNYSMLFFGDSGTYEFYEPYQEKMTDLMLTEKSYNQACFGAIKQIADTKLITEDSLTFTEKVGINFWNKENLNKDGYFDVNDTFISDTNYYTSDYIYVRNYKKVSLYTTEAETPTLDYIRIMSCYDEELNLIRVNRYENSNRIKETVEIPKNTAYIRVAIRKEFNDKAMLVFDDVIPKEYEPYKIRLKNVEMPILGENKLQGKILFNFGDSIAAGDGNNGKGYSEIIGEMYGMHVHDFAVGGSTLGGNIPNQIDIAIARNVIPDYILIEGGTNDINDGSSIGVGNITSSFDISQFDKTTTTGGLEYCLYKLKNAFPSAKIIFVSVHKMSSRNYDKQVERQKACIDVCEKWCIPVADVGRKGNLNTFLTCMHKFTNPTSSQPNGDRTHPNDLGYITFYVDLIYKVMISI